MVDKFAFEGLIGSKEIAVGDFIAIKEKTGAIYRGTVVEIVNDDFCSGYRLHLYDYSYFGMTMKYQDTPSTQYNEEIPYVGFHPISEIASVRKATK